MIWGTQWDRTLEWLNDTGMDWDKIASNSGSWGNYYDVTFTYKTSEEGNEQTKQSNTSTLVPTGSSEYNKANNIYDLAGNLYEWTQEAYGTVSRVYRGGFYYDNGSDGPARYRYYNNPNNTLDNRGSRPTLYIVELNSGE